MSLKRLGIRLAKTPSTFVRRELIPARSAQITFANQPLNQPNIPSQWIEETVGPNV